MVIREYGIFKFRVRFPVGPPIKKYHRKMVLFYWLNIGIERNGFAKRKLKASDAAFGSGGPELGVM